MGLICVTKRGKFSFGPERGGARVRAVVVTVATAEMGLVPLGVTLDGDTEQEALASVGALEQLRETGALNPNSGVTVSV